MGLDAVSDSVRALAGQPRPSGPVLLVGAAPASWSGRHLQPDELQGFNEDRGHWGALLLWHGGAAVDAIDFFAAVERLLHPGQASVFVVDRFVTARETADQGDCHQLDHFIALAARNGWKLAWQQQSTLDALRVLAGLHFERRPGPRDTVARIDAGLAPAMRELFCRVFGHEMSAQHWQWKYGEGRGSGVALARDGRLVAHFAGLSRQVLRQGVVESAWQIGDVMVAADANRALVRNGPLMKVAASFIEAEVGWGRSHRFGFGFPSDRHYQVAERLGLYTAVDALVRVVWPARAVSDPGPALQWLAPAGGPFAAAESDAVDACWQAMAEGFADAVLGVRNAAWLSYRYLQRPLVQYRVGLVREHAGGSALGAIVLREHESHLDLLDLVGAPAHFGALVEAACVQAGACGRPRVDLWLTRSQLQRLPQACRDAATVHDLGITVPANVHTPGVPALALRDRWFLLGGDADFT